MEMENDFMDSMNQKFDNEKLAIEFEDIIKKYLPIEQVKREGTSVTCYAKRKSESWYLTLFTANVMMKKKGYELPENLMTFMVNLASDLDNEEYANSIEEAFKSVGLTQKKLIQEIEKL